MERIPLRDQLAEARRRGKISQEQLAEALGWKGHTHVSKIENGDASTQLEEADAWARRCGYEIALVPIGTPDPEGLQNLVATVDDPSARRVIADLVRLVTTAPRRYWWKFVEDIEHEAGRAQRDAAERA